MIQVWMLLLDEPSNLGGGGLIDGVAGVLDAVMMITDDDWQGG